MQNVKLELKALDSREAVFHVPTALLARTWPMHESISFDPANYNVHLMSRCFTSEGDKLVRQLAYSPGLSFRASEYSVHVTVPGAFDMREELLGVFAVIYQWLKCDVQFAVITASEVLIEPAFVLSPSRGDFWEKYDQAVSRLKSQRDHEVRLAMELLDRLVQITRDHPAAQNEFANVPPAH